MAVAADGGAGCGSVSVDAVLGPRVPFSELGPPSHFHRGRHQSSMEMDYLENGGRHGSLCNDSESSQWGIYHLFCPCHLNSLPFQTETDHHILNLILVLLPPQ